MSRPLSMGRVLRLLISLGFRLSTRREAGAFAAAVAVVFTLCISSVAAFGLRRALVLCATVPDGHIWLPFALTLFSFLIGLLWVAWPVVAGRTDETYELDRYLGFPISPRRLYGAHTVVALFEGTSLVFYPVLVLLLYTLVEIGTLQAGPVPLSIALLLSVAYVWMNVAVTRGLLNVLLNVMASRRSGEALGFFGLLLLGFAAWLPPVDVSWLFSRLQGMGVAGADLGLLVRATRSLGAMPTGWYGSGLLAVAAGNTAAALGYALGMACVGLATWWVWLRALLRFHRRGTGRFARLPRIAPPVPGPCFFFRGQRVAVFVYELKRLVREPRVRLLFFVPLYLTIATSIVGGGALAQYAWGAQWAANMVLVMGGYALASWGTSLLSNVFGHDESGLVGLLSAPVGIGGVLWGKGLAHLVLVLVQLAILAALVLLMQRSNDNGLTSSGSAATLRAFAASLGVLSAAAVSLMAVGWVLSLVSPWRVSVNMRRLRQGSWLATVLMLLTLASMVGLGRSLVAWFGSWGLVPTAMVSGLVVVLALARARAMARQGAFRERLHLTIARRGD